VVGPFDQYSNWLLDGVYKVSILPSDAPRPCRGDAPLWASRARARRPICLAWVPAVWGAKFGPRLWGPWDTNTRAMRMRGSPAGFHQPQIIYIYWLSQILSLLSWKTMSSDPERKGINHQNFGSHSSNKRWQKSQPNRYHASAAIRSKDRRTSASNLSNRDAPQWLGTSTRASGLPGMWTEEHDEGQL